MAIVALLGLTVVVSRSAWESRRELRLGRAGLGAKDPERAIAHFSRALRWYVPGDPIQREAAQQLWDLGEAAELRGDPRQALLAYRQLRRGLHATASLWIPQREALVRANERIAALMAGQGQRNRAGEPAPFSEREREHLALLSASRAPHPGWSLLVVLGFLGWVGAAISGIWLGLDEDGRVRARPLQTSLLLGGLAFGLWLLALWKA